MADIYLYRMDMGPATDNEGWRQRVGYEILPITWWDRGTCEQGPYNEVYFDCRYQV